VSTSSARRSRTAPISLGAARRIALSAQAFGRPRPGPAPPDARQIAALIRRLGLLQLDSVNVFCRAHYMPIFSRLGPYDTTILDRMAAHGPGRRRDRRLIEYWGHEASLIPVESQPLFRWRMLRVQELWGSMIDLARDRPELVADTLELVAEQGPVRASATGIPRPEPRPGHMWNWHDGKRALEHLFFTGRVTAAARVNFERLYDLTERVLPPSVLAAPTPTEAEAQRQLLRISARALGVATEPDLGDYFRLPRADSKAQVAELVAAGELIPAKVEGWDAPAYLWHETSIPRNVHARALLSPFDPLVWFRQRAERLFQFVYRIEIYTPAPKRVYGYYVLPFLLGDSLVARVDLKADRQAGVLRVQSAHAEPGVDLEYVATELAAELELARGWLGLESGISVARRGGLSGALVQAVRSVGWR
jgi:uncharacterized protein YcaQ